MFSRSSEKARVAGAECARVRSAGYKVKQFVLGRESSMMMKSLVNHCEGLMLELQKM